MPEVKFIKPFKFSPNGIDVIEYPASRDAQSVGQLCADIACQHGFAEPVAKAPAKAVDKVPAAPKTLKATAKTVAAEGGYSDGQPSAPVEGGGATDAAADDAGAGEAPGAEIAGDGTADKVGE